MTSSNRQIIWTLGIGLFWVLFLWRFWENGVFAMGFNATIFLLLASGFVIYSLRHHGLWSRQNIVWLAPLGLIVLSYGVYENPFIKVVNIPIYLLLFIIFVNYGLVRDHARQNWSVGFFFRLLANIFTPLARLLRSATDHAKFLGLAGGEQKRIGLRVIFGLILFILIAGLVIIPLLSASDPDFKSALGGFYEWLASLIPGQILARILVGIFLSLFFYAVFLAWDKLSEYRGQEAGDKKIDNIVSGIVIGGILAIYLLFLGIQFGNLAIRALPANFPEVETLVKSGFWQLMFLSIINIFIFLVYYKKTNRPVQNILAVFTVASLLMLFSAGYRMILYVVYYGFSYEKFFALYTVLYCAILYFYLIAKLIARTRLNIIKFVLFLFLWMYALLTVFPTEQFIVRSNVGLATRQGSHINLSELRMLSADVLSYVKQNSDIYFKDEVWTEWMQKRQDTVNTKRWYEYNLANIFYLFF